VSRLTDWFPVDIDPVHEGRYRRRAVNEWRGTPMGDGIWKNGRWFRRDGQPSLFKCEWRGLSKPAQEPKL
jgi:hypothetical protein